jgi:hypothetical protein
MVVQAVAVEVQRRGLELLVAQDRKETMVELEVL